MSQPIVMGLAPSARFCENRLCQFHVACESDTAFIDYRVSLEGSVRLRRLTLVVEDKKKTLHLCEVCANVAAMINGK